MAADKRRVADEVATNGSEAGAGNRDLATGSSGFSEEKGRLSPRYPAGATPEIVENDENSSANLLIFAKLTASQNAKSGDKNQPPPGKQRLLALVEQVAQSSPEILAMAAEARTGGIKQVTCPEAFDAAARLKVCVLLKIGYSRSMAAMQLGFSRSTVGKVMQRDPVFKQQVLRAEELYESQPLLTVIEAAQKDWRAAVWLMKHHRPHDSVARRQNKRQRRVSNRDWEDFFGTSIEELTERGQARKAREEAKRQKRKEAKKKGS